MLNLPPLSLYIHFPWCVHKCPYCDFNSHVFKKEIPEREYIDSLLKDLQNDLSYIQEREVQSIYLGGGTPSLFSSNAMVYLFKRLQEMIKIASTAEITIEANPESVTTEKLNSYQEAGINRVSLGIQSLKDDYLKRLGRAHNSLTATKAIEAVLNAGFTNFNVDLMYGLPGQTEEEGLYDIQRVLTVKPPHVSWYQLTIEPHTAFFKKPPTLPIEETLINLQLKGITALMERGLSQYEISAFSQKGFESFHNNNYWAFGDYIGIGAGAHSKLTIPSTQSILRQWKWSNPRQYLSSFLYQEGKKVIQPNQLPFEFMLNSLRRYQPIERALFEGHTGLHWEDLIPYFEKAAHKDLVKWDKDSLVVTELGRRFYNDLVSLFL